jgi:hypothetical protein
LIPHDVVVINATLLAFEKMYVFRHVS